MEGMLRSFWWRSVLKRGRLGEVELCFKVSWILFSF